MSLVKMLLLECENWILGKPLVSISTGGFLLPFLQSYFIKEVDKVTGFIVLVAYTLLMLGVSYLLTRRQTTLQGFLVGGGQANGDNQIRNEYCSYVDMGTRLIRQC